ncbi:MAG: C25 family cysteine peptidase [Candidatus Krumholzibacteriia bacterium]
MKVRRRLLSVFSCALLAVLIAASCAQSATVRLTIRFAPPRLEALPGGFSQVVFPATVQAGKPGEPSYPFRGVQALLPPGESISGVSIIRGGWKLIGGSHRLHPAQAVLPGMEIDAAKQRFLYNAAAYGVTEWVYPPEAPFRTHYLRGHAIASGTVCPVGFIPATGETGYYGTIDVVIETAASDEAREALRLARTDPGTVERVSRIVGNPGELSRYEGLATPLGDPGDVFEYLIVTAEQFADDFLQLRDFYTRRGMRARIMTVEEITAAYGGVDAAERIRNAIKDKYVNNGITHVLLGGDWDGGAADPKIVPYRGLYGEVHSSEVYTDTNLPGDLYFAALDGTWNADGDALWGEPGEDDPYSEIAVGRASVDTPDEIAHFIAKTTMYQDHPVAGEVKRALLLGEKLWDNPLTYGEDEVELLVGTHADNGFTTTGIPPEFSIVRKYDRQYGFWPGTAVFDEVNAGTSWIGHAGHSNTNYVMRISRTDVTDVNFLNDGVASNFPVLCSTGCYDGSFDNRLVSGSFETADCIAEQMVSINHGAVAFVCNSRYGWFNEGQTSGPSIHFMREFFDAVFTEGYTTLGAANQRSKDETVPFLDLPGEWEPGAVRWCFYGLNLLGDPALDGWTDTPESLAVSHPAGIDRYAAGIEIETGLAGAMASLYRDGVCYGRGTADAIGHIDLVRFMTFPDSISSIELNVLAHNRYARRDTLVIMETTSVQALTPSHATLEQNAPNPFNPSTVIRFSLARDGEIDLRVYDAAGRAVATLARGRATKGAHAVTWRPDGLSSGIYFYALRTQEATITRKAVLIR